MPDAGLTDEEVDAMLAAKAQDDAVDRQRQREQRNRELAEMDLLGDEVEQMLEGGVIGGVVDQDELVRRGLARREREQQEVLLRQNWQRQAPARQGNHVVVADRVMQLIEGGQLWAHVDEPNVQLRVTQADGDAVTVAPVGISAQMGLPGLFQLHREVSVDHFRHVPGRQERSLPHGDMEYAADRLAQLADEHLKDKKPEEDDIERRSIWERLMDDADDGTNDLIDTIHDLGDKIAKLNDD